MGQLIAGLKKEGLDENTLVIFVGDNGTGGDGKGTVTELGARVPCIIRGPGVKPGLVSRAVGDLTDFLPTLADFAGVTLPKDRVFDGHSLGPVLRGEKPKHRDWIYSHLDDGRILRDDRWLLEIANGNKEEKFFDCGACRDGSTYKDVTDSSEPEVVAARTRFAEILASLPEPKPHPEQAAQRDGEGKGKPAAGDDRIKRFRQRDQDGDGFISHDEFIRTITGSDQKAGEARFKKFDANGDGQVSQEEFLAISTK